MSISWRVLGLLGLIVVAGLSLGLLVWGTCTDSPAHRAWALWFGAVAASWGVVYAQVLMESGRCRRIAHQERLAEVMEMDPGRH